MPPNYPPQNVFRSSRAVPPPYHPPPKVLGFTCSITTQWLFAKALILIAGITFLISSLYLPILLNRYEVSRQHDAAMDSIHITAVESNPIISSPLKDTTPDKLSRLQLRKDDEKGLRNQGNPPPPKKDEIIQKAHSLKQHVDIKQQPKHNQNGTMNNNSTTPFHKDEEGRIPYSITIQQLQLLPPFPRPLTLNRGVSGLPLSQTPALIGAQRGKIHCDVQVDHLAYWNEPVGDFDVAFVSPFASTTETKNKYVTFENDPGGWNNIRMSMEIVAVFAAATGRILVLPPDMPLYLSNKRDKKGKTKRSVGDFFPMTSPNMKHTGHLQVIRFEDFIQLQDIQAQYPYENEKEKQAVLAGANSCILMRISEVSCFGPYDYMRRIGYSIGKEDTVNATASMEQFDAMATCLIFDEDVVKQSDPSMRINSTMALNVLDSEKQNKTRTFCENREPIFYDQYIEKQPIFHFRTQDSSSRMLNHFYSFLHFTNSRIGNHYLRFVRDFMHYHDEIYCAAGKIVLALQTESKQRGYGNADLDEEGGGGYSSFHIRRGDFQYPDVKISAQEWYDNTKELFPQKPMPTELMYIATDERNKTFFNDLAMHYDLRFLDDYWELASLGDLDPNFMGMIDKIVSSRARVFVGTWFSTFTGYINRMRGYHGITMHNSWYGTLDRKERMQNFSLPTGNYIGRDWHVCWVGIDGDSVPAAEGNITRL